MPGARSRLPTAEARSAIASAAAISIASIDHGDGRAIALGRVADQRRGGNGPSVDGGQPSDERPFLAGYIDSGAAQRVAQEIKRSTTARGRDVDAFSCASAIPFQGRVERHLAPECEET